MEYGYIVNEQLIYCDSNNENAKLLVYSDPFEGAAYYLWEEGTATIRQVWYAEEVEE